MEEIQENMREGFRKGIFYMGTLVEISELVKVLHSRYKHRKNFSLGFIDSCLESFLEFFEEKVGKLENINNEYLLGGYLSSIEFPDILGYGCGATLSDFEGCLLSEFEEAHRKLEEYVAYSKLEQEVKD